MTLLMCSQGHYYDSKKDAECPMCRKLKDSTLRSSMGGINSQRTVSAWQLHKNASSEDVIVLGSSRQFEADDGKTIGIFSAKKGNDFVTGWLVCVKGPERGRDYRLHNGYNNLGRGTDQDVFVADDPEISRDGHCSIIYDPKHAQFLLMPLKGNLVYMGEKLIEHPTRLESGDRFQAGSSEFELVAFCRKEHTWEN